MNNNILILSAGRRVELVKLFKKASLQVSEGSKIYTADAVELIPARYFSDGFFKIPKIGDRNYIDKLIEIVKENNIKLIVPTIDTELLTLSLEKKRIEAETNCKVLVSDYDVIKVCRDKVTTQEFMEKNDFDMPKMIEFEDLNQDSSFPIFIKPKSGSSSIGAYKISNYNELLSYSKTIEDPIIQEFVEGEEYTVDVFLDFNSNIISIVPRLRIATRSGEISKGKIVKDKLVMNEVRKLMEVMKPIGHITVQLFKSNNHIKFIEVNPRFGGGAPMSIQSGADSCENLYRLLMGENLEYNENYRDNIMFFRFDNSICVDENLEIVQW